MNIFLLSYKEINFIPFFFFFETGSLYVAQADLELSILLPQLPKCWDFRDIP